MPRIAPVRGLHYAATRFGDDLTAVVCPPYDVISPEMRAELLARHERNAVRLELSAEPDPHRAAAEALAAWRAEGTLVEPAEASVYRYVHGTRESPDAPAVRAILARVLLEPWGGGVRPHEHTMPGPKADRLALLRATRTQLSPILALYFDRSADHDGLLDAGWTDERYARDADGIVHRLARGAPEAAVEHLSDRTLYVADGHHRYETALAFQAEVRSDPALAGAPPGSLGADWILIALVNAEREALEVQPTHRLVLDADRAALAELARGGHGFSVLGVAQGLLERALDDAEPDAPALGLVLPARETFLLRGDRGALAERMRHEAGSGALRGLDLSVLHAAILGDRLGIGADAVAAGERLAYTRSAADAIARVERGEALAAFIVRPTRLDQLAAVAEAGDVMPQKSTYFYPKLLTGMVFNSLED